MTIALTSFLSKLNVLVNDNISGTTTSAGGADKLTLIDSALTKYGNGYFGDRQGKGEWWVYASSQLRSIKEFHGDSGTIVVHNAFSALIASGTAYSVHRFDRDMKIAAMNQALFDCYPWFYKRLEDESSLTGQGSSDTEYAIPATFTPDFPEQVYYKYEDGDDIRYIPITGVDFKEKSGTKYMYADITEGEPILLVGKTYLTQFTTDASTTELDNAQAEVVALLAASILCRMISAKVNATDSGRYDSLASRYENQYYQKLNISAQPRLASTNLNWDWLTAYED